MILLYTHTKPKYLYNKIWQPPNTLHPNRTLQSQIKRSYPLRPLDPINIVLLKLYIYVLRVWYLKVE